MTTPSGPVQLSKRPLALRSDGKAQLLPSSSRAHPAVHGYTIGCARMRRSPPHGGELHPDGDEVLYLVSGRIDVILEEADGERVHAVEPGQAVVVPQGIWHRVDVHEPCELIFITPGPRKSHRPLQRKR
jgi:mannose-6-phosphate isomerase-like protein (cupin superfamily)